MTIHPKLLVKPQETLPRDPLGLSKDPWPPPDYLSSHPAKPVHSIYRFDCHHLQLMSSPSKLPMASFSFRHTFIGLLIGISLVLMANLTAFQVLIPESFNRFYSSTFRLSEDHKTWLTWHKVQLNNPFVPNHDPNNLGDEPPEDLKKRRPQKIKADPEVAPVKMILPKKLDIHRPDEL
ncbi:hypothetical protein O181_037536 [Austropuccinia psidii MF-1]|uniref:Uncharacterized protein n=1 Tax=Austropuccinia psidii MF-1 TaxID=1389203 RepID=A0A9Q3D6D5_9BASI|nr:hypothetical protein [Austropuccinia psidii MF-1]